MPRVETQGSGLATIFSIFLGLMLAAFVGVGAYTFHPPPSEQFALRDLTRREEQLLIARSPDQLSPAERAEWQRLTAERHQLQDAATRAQEGWGRRTSIILIVVATLAMAGSLVRADALPVLSNVLGYVRFVRRARAAAASFAEPVTDHEPGGLERRVEALEARMRLAASALDSRLSLLVMVPLMLGACMRPGGGGSQHLPPPGLLEGQATPLSLAFSVWGAGTGRLDRRFTDVRLHYRVGGSAPFAAIGGTVEQADDTRMRMRFELPPVGVVGDTVQYYFDYLLDGHRNTRDTVRIQVLRRGTSTSAGHHGLLTDGIPPAGQG